MDRNRILSIFSVIIGAMKTGIIDVGGGLRDIYGAGILDGCLDQGISFDYGIGVSAGSGNIATFLAGQRGRNKRFYSDYAMRKEYMSLSNLIKKRKYMDLDYIYGTLANSTGEDPMDYEAFVCNPMVFEVVSTDARTGEPVYFDGKKMPLDHYDILKASSCIPVICAPYPIGDKIYFDGGLSDPVPIQRAWDHGVERLVVILTKPRDLIRDPKKDALPAKVLAHSYPQAAQALALRAKVYNRQVAQAKEGEAQGKVCILAPDGIGDLKTLTRDSQQLEILYQKGVQDAHKIRKFLNL